MSLQGKIKNMNPKISIITVTYNAESVLRKTIESIVGQTYSNMEYIIIDGTSKDKTVDIIRKYEQQVAYWVSEPDKGLYDAMNKGLQKATGDYVWFINAGDTLQNNQIVAQVARIAEEEHLPDVIYGETDLVDAEGRFMAQRRLKTPEKLTRKSFRMGMLVCHQAFIAKREMAPLYDLSYRFSADFDWCIRCMKPGGKIVNTHMRLVNYLYEGLTTGNRKASLKERYRIMCENYGKVSVFFLHIWFAIRFYWAKFVKNIV